MFLRSYLQKTSREETAPFIALLMLFIAIFVILFLQRSFLLAVVAVAVVGYIVTIGLKPYALPVVLLFYLCIAPIHYIGKDLEFYKVYYYASLTPLFLFTMAIIFILERAIILIRHEQNLHAQCPPYKFDIESILLIFLGIWIIFQMLRGFSLGYDSTVIRGEVVEMSPIFGYFIWSTVVRGSKHTTIWLQLFLLAAVITSCVFILFIYKHFALILNFVMGQLATRQGVLTIATIPLLYAFFFSTRSLWMKMIYAIGLFITYVHVLLTLGRILWIISILETILFISLYFFRNGFNRRALLIWTFTLIIAVLLMGLLVFIAMQYFDVDISQLFNKWKTFGTMKDVSTRMRLFDIQTAWGFIKRNPILGTGLGKTIFTVPTSSLFYYIDNSYIIALMKGGVVLLLLILSFYLLALWKAWMVYYKATDPKTKLIGAAIFTIIGMILVYSSATAMLLYYEFGYVWVLLIAVSAFLYETQVRSPHQEDAGLTPSQERSEE